MRKPSFVQQQDAEQGHADLLMVGLLCGLAILSDLSYAGLTSLVIGYRDSLHFDLITTGWLASSEGAGFTLGALVAAVGGRFFRVSRRLVVTAFLVLAAMQLLSAGITQAVPLAACRAVSGFSAGLTYAVGLSAMAVSRNPGRAFALYFGAIFVSGLVALGVIPTVLNWVGLRGFYVGYATLILLCVPTVRWYPIVPKAAPESQSVESIAPTEAALRRRSAILLNASIFLNFIFNGGIWVLAEHFGLQIEGTDPQSLGGLLAGTMLFGLLGTALATVVAQRWSQLTIVVIGNLGLIVAVIALSCWHTVTGLITAMAFLNSAVTFLTPALFAALTARSEQGAQWGNLASQAGYSAGPVAVAAIAARSGMDGLALLSVFGFVGSAALAWLGLAHFWRSAPAPGP